MGVLEYLISFIKGFVCTRSFVVSVKDSLSSPKNIPDGVLRGSLIGPFLLFINDIPIPTGREIATNPI
jgi:hypothetical protein